MKIHRFIGLFSFSAKTTIIDDGDTVHQIKNVLRLRPGEIIALCSSENEQEAQCKIVSYEGKKVLCEVQSVTQNTKEFDVPLVLYCSILKKENFEWVVQKATELGVTEIYPLMCERTIKLGVRADRLQKIAKEAAEQSGRARVPDIKAPIELQDAFLKNGYDIKLFFDELGDKVKEKNFIKKSIALFIGPEGGWAPEEIENAKKAGCQIVSLGKTILRAETAATVAVFWTIQNSAL